MLAQNLKTPTDLELSETVFKALISVLRMLEREEVPHCPVKHLDYLGANKGFNLAEWECGSVRCIGGWAEHLAGLTPMSLHRAAMVNDGLSQLFYPDSHGIMNYKEMHAVTTEQAAIALRNYLTHGEPGWREALAV